MDDRLEQIKMVNEEAIVGLVNQARRLNMTSVLSKEANAERLPQDPECGQYIMLDLADLNPTHEDALRVLAAANRKARRANAEKTQPPPPPPSPRGRDQFSELWDEYMETAEMVDSICLEARTLKADMMYYEQHHRDITLVQEIELETVKRSLDSMESLVGDLGIEIESQEFNETMKRCRSTLERFALRDSIESESPTDCALDKEAKADEFLLSTGEESKNSVEPTFEASGAAKNNLLDDEPISTIV